jgi:hypothetical protein
MNSNFDSLFSQLCQAEDYYQINEANAAIDKLAKSTDITDNLLTKLDEQLTKEGWNCLCRLIFVLQRYPNAKFVPFLCNLLDNYRQEVYMEAIIDALLIINDVQSVPSLIRALNYDLVGDVDCHFNRKIINALSNIGTKEAIEGIKMALHHRHILVKEEAEKHMEYFNESANLDSSEA